MRHLLGTSLLSLLLLATPASAQPDEAGRLLYTQHCAACHGGDLTGGNGPSLVDAEWKHGAARADVAVHIKQGFPEAGMPGFGAVLSDADVDRLIDYIDAVREGTLVALPASLDSLETFDYALRADVFAQGLEIPWAIDFIGDEMALIVERPGRVRVVEHGRLRPEPVAGTPAVLHEGQGGLLDVAVDPDYAETGWIYLAYSHAVDVGASDDRPVAMTRIVRGRIRDNAWVDQEVLFEAPHETYGNTRHHYGSRIVFDHDGYLFFSIGDRGVQDQAQDLGRPNGKVHRIHRDGSIPDDNPFVGRPDALPSIYSYGHRNPQGIAVHPETGEIWAVEHGPRGGDELNRVEAGLNYGWPVITYGINYNGSVITDARSAPGMEQPIFYWRPSIAVSGLDFYEGGLFPAWRHRLVVSSLRQEEIRLLHLEHGRVMQEEVILRDAGRIRETVAGPDGALYVVLNEPDMVLRLTPRAR